MTPANPSITTQEVEAGCAGRERTKPVAIDRSHEEAAMAASLAKITRRRIFSGARQIAGRRWQREPNWVVAMTVFGVGSTYAHALCHEMGIDPDSRHASPWATPTTRAREAEEDGHAD